MAVRSSLLLSLLIAVVACASLVSAYDATFDQYMTFEPYCAGKYTCTRWDDGTVQLASNYNDMGGAISKRFYQHGIFSVKIKFPKAYSGGVLPSFYLMAGKADDWKQRHDEIDFEFLGGNTPQDITIHTNLYSQGYQFLEQFKFPFDPSADFHTYGIVWNQWAVTWYVDNIPIRVTPRNGTGPYPRAALRVHTSIWDSSSWSPLKSNYAATGQVAIAMKNFNFMHTCSLTSAKRTPPCAWSANPSLLWNHRLIPAQRYLYRKWRKTQVVKSFGWQKV